MGVGGLLIPVVSITAALTLLPALLAIFGASLLRMRVPMIGLRPEGESGHLGAHRRDDHAAARRSSPASRAGSCCSARCPRRCSR